MQCAERVDAIDELETHVECVVGHTPPKKSTVGAPEAHIMELSFGEAEGEERVDERA